MNAAEQLTHYIDTHPNGNRLLVSISGDEITLVSHVPALCDDFVTPTKGIADLPAKLARVSAGLVCGMERPGPGHAAGSAYALLAGAGGELPARLTIRNAMCWCCSSCIRCRAGDGAGSDGGGDAG